MKARWFPCVLLVSLLLAVATWADGDKLVVSGCDVLCRPGEEAALGVVVEKTGWRHKDAKGALVSAFLLTPTAREPLGSTVTDHEGRATIPLRFAEPGLYRVAVEAVVVNEKLNKRGREEFLVACRGTDRVTVVLDIDDTLTAQDSSFLGHSAAVRDPDTVSVVSALAEQYDLIYVTGRVRWLSPETRRWLEQAGFPRAPLFLRGLKLEEALSVETYKAKVLSRLRLDFPNILIGVGDEDPDVMAYVKNGMLAILLDEKERESWNVTRWSEIRELLLGEEVTFTTVLSGSVERGGRPWRFECRKGDGGWVLSAEGKEFARGSWPAVRSALLEHLRGGEPRP